MREKEKAQPGLSGGFCRNTFPMGQLIRGATPRREDSGKAALQRRSPSPAGQAAKQCLRGLAAFWTNETALPLKMRKGGLFEKKDQMVCLTRSRFLGALGVVEAVQRAHQIAGDAADALKGHDPSSRRPQLGAGVADDAVVAAHGVAVHRVVDGAIADAATRACSGRPSQTRPDSCVGSPSISM